MALCYLQQKSDAGGQVAGHRSHRGSVAYRGQREMRTSALLVLVSEIADACDQGGWRDEQHATTTTLREMVRAKGESRWNTQRPRPTSGALWR
jgi:hypothetical protein